MDEYVKKLILGCTKSNALRAVTLDAKAKSHPEYREAIGDGSILEKLTLTIGADGTYADNSVKLLT